MRSIDFIKCGTAQSDIDLFLAPVDTDQPVIFFETHEKLVLAHFMQQAGIFPSVSQARKNGWDKPVPKGFSQFTVGKNKVLITILNIEDTNG